MEQQLIEFVDGIKANKQIGAFDEASTKQAIVLRLLFLLGWDIFNVDEVNPNLANETQQADYALSIKNCRKVIIKVFKPKETLDKYQEKVFEYASKKRVEFAILTNGVTWWFYLSANKGDALQNRFVELDLLKQKTNDIAEQLTAFLKRDEVSKGSSLNGAAGILKKKLQQTSQKVLPEAWSKILSEPHAVLIKLLSEAAEKISGFPVEKDAIIKFLNQRLRQPQQTEGPAWQPEEKAVFRSEKAVPSPAKGAQKTYESQSIASFSLKGKTYKVKSWEDLLVKMCEVLKTEHLQDIESLQWLSVGKKYYFNTNPDELRVPASIAGTDIFVESYLSPTEAATLAQSVLAEFGFSENDLKINN